MNDAEPHDLDEEIENSEAGSIGSAHGSRKGSASRGHGGAGADRKKSRDDEADASLRKANRTSLVAPSSGGDDSINADSDRDEEGDGGEGGEGTERTVSGDPEEGGGFRVEEGDASGTRVTVSEDVAAQGYQEVIAWVRHHLVLPRFSPERHWREVHNEVSGGYECLVCPATTFQDDNFPAQLFGCT